MAGVDGSVRTSSPGGAALHSSASKDESLAFYKAQYEALEAELADFQASSKELEAELERDVEEAEKRERALREKNEALQYEVDEWKSKCKQAKAESNTAHNTLQKEITALRDTNRTQHLQLRDIEVQNDDFERQARNTTSSLEDLESKYAVAIERSVILEGEMKTGEQEREALRIETQRLRDELSDLKVEAEIRQDKLRHAEAASSRLHPPAAASAARPQSATSERTPTDTTDDASTIATPPTKSGSSVASNDLTPPSPPASDRSQPTRRAAPATTPAHQAIKSRLSITNSTTPRPPASRPPRPPRTSIPAAGATPAHRRTSASLQHPHLPNSASLVQIRGLIGKMQRLEQRVQHARSKLPAPTSTPPRASPRPGSALSHTSAAASAGTPLAPQQLPGNVTMRSARKRTSATATSTRDSSAAAPDAREPAPRPSSRLSRGYAPAASAAAATPSREPRGLARPPSRSSLTGHAPENQRPPSRQSLTGSAAAYARPPSRQSLSARLSMSHLTGLEEHTTSPGSYTLNAGAARPASRQGPGLSARQSMSQLAPAGRPASQAGGRPASQAGARPASQAGSRPASQAGAHTPLGHYHANTLERAARPRSSVGGSYGGGGFSQSVHGSRPSLGGSGVYGAWEEGERSPGGMGEGTPTPTPGRRTSGIPAPSKEAARKSLGLGKVGDMGPPMSRRVNGHGHGHGHGNGHGSGNANTNGSASGNVGETF